MTGITYEPRTYENLFKRTLKAAQLPDINFHALRHTFATRALEAGMDIKVLSSILGHAQASTTLNLYAHALPDHKKQSIDKMSSFYGGYIEEYQHMIIYESGTGFLYKTRCLILNLRPISNIVA